MFTTDLGRNEDAEELITREELKDTPFTIISVDGKTFGSMGKYRITEPYEDVAKLRRDLKKITWNRLVQVMYCMLDQRENLINLIKEEE